MFTEHETRAPKHHGIAIMEGSLQSYKGPVYPEGRVVFSSPPAQVPREKSCQLETLFRNTE